MHWVIGALLLGACRGTEAPPPVEPAPVEVTVSSVVPHMEEHLRQIAAARDAVIFGDADAAIKAMRWLAEHEPPDDLPPGSRHYVERMRAAARTATYTESLHAIGRGVASAAYACGECHTDTVGDLRITIAPPPNVDAGLVAHMARHVWAAEKMWHALIGPQRGAWAEASALLAESPLYEAPEGKLMSEETAAFAKKVHDLGVGTLTAASPSDRIALYGEFLATCADCHATTREPQPAPEPEP